MNRAIRGALEGCLRRMYRRDVSFELQTLIDDESFDYKTDLAERLHGEFRRHRAYANMVTVRDLHDELSDFLEGADGVQRLSFMDNHTYIAVTPGLVRARWDRLLQERALIVDLRLQPDLRSDLLIELLGRLRKSSLVRVDLAEEYRISDYAKRQALVLEKLRAFEACEEQVEFVVNHSFFDLRRVKGRVHRVYPSNEPLDRCSHLFLNKLSQGVSRRLEARSSWAEEFLPVPATPAADDSEALRKLVVKLFDDLLEVMRGDGCELHAQVSRQAEQLRRSGHWQSVDGLLREETRRLLTEVL